MRPAASMTTWRGLVLCALALAVVLVAWASTDTAPLMTTTAPSTRPQPSAAPTVLLPSLWAQALVVMVVLVAGVLACLVAWRLVRFLLAHLQGLQPVAVDTPAEGCGPDLALLSPSRRHGRWRHCGTEARPTPLWRPGWRWSETSRRSVWGPGPTRPPPSWSCGCGRSDKYRPRRLRISPPSTARPVSPPTR